MGCFWWYLFNSTVLQGLHYIELQCISPISENNTMDYVGWDQVTFFVWVSFVFIHEQLRKCGTWTAALQQKLKKMVIGLNLNTLLST